METKQELQESFLNGRMLLVDKPYQWTSFDVANKIKHLLKFRLGIPKIRIGHAGTLDPLATGLLIICTGKFTKKISEFQELDKTYTGTFCLGQTTPSFDLETQPGNLKPIDHVTAELLMKTAEIMTGVQSQTPPLYSAKKIGGERAYMHARKGEKTILKPNTIEIKRFDITKIDLPEVDFQVVCSKGTYIRSLASDFGIMLGTGAYLQSLRRTKIGTYSSEEALKVDQLEEMMTFDG
ncbi:MAG: tRNA pseudouridine(55) synthase TruB [Bacteroidia bacterium]|nr:MAG: tRNA pseudouridine(55) synthase TruB [Bacteroidia bacterium]